MKNPGARPGFIRNSSFCKKLSQKREKKSFQRKLKSIDTDEKWIPALAGITLFNI